MHVEGGSDGGVEGSQDDIEDAEGDGTDSSNVSVEVGDVASDGVGNCKCENDGTMNKKRRRGGRSSTDIEKRWIHRMLGCGFQFHVVASRLLGCTESLQTL